MAMKVTTKIAGKTKDNFIKDCVNKDRLEGEVGKMALDVYYSIDDFVPNNTYMEFPEIKKYIIDKNKL